MIEKTRLISGTPDVIHLKGKIDEIIDALNDLNPKCGHDWEGRYMELEENLGKVQIAVDNAMCNKITACICHEPWSCVDEQTVVEADTNEGGVPITHKYYRCRKCGRQWPLRG